MDLGKYLLPIGSLAAAVGGFEFFRYLFLRKSVKRKADAEAKDAELETLRKQYDWLEEKYEALNRKVDELYTSIHELEERNMALVKHNSELQIALKVAEWNKCERPDDDCLRRLPPRLKCRLKDFLAGKYDDLESDGKEEKQ